MYTNEVSLRSDLSKNIIGFDEEKIRASLEEVEQIVRLYIPFVLPSFVVKSEARNGKFICSVDWMGLICAPAIRAFIVNKLKSNARTNQKNK